MQCVDYLKTHLLCFILVGLKVSDQGLLWLITKLTTLYTVECMLAPHDQEVKTVSSHERCYPHCSAYVVLCNAILDCSAYVVLFTAHILAFIFITVEYSPYGMQLYVLMLLMIVHLLLNVDKDACCYCAMHVYLIYGI